MEKTNELNKLLSYIHMGNSIFRIYYDHAEKEEDYKLLELITSIMEKFKTHEEIITRLINEHNEEATNSLTAAGVLGVYKEKMKMFDSSFSIIISAIKATNMGMLSTMKFYHENSQLEQKILDKVKEIIIDYEKIQKQLIDYYLNV